MGKLTECAVTTFTFARVFTTRKARASSGKREAAHLAYSLVVAAAPQRSVFCFTDGSASPNPGPSGAGAAVFLRKADGQAEVIDLGVPLGWGTNNHAEIFAIGMVLVAFLPPPPQCVYFFR